MGDVDVEVWSGFMWLRIFTVVRLVWTWRCTIMFR